jgi:hypothetical protein
MYDCVFDVFYVVYKILFGILLELYAGYDRSFSRGLGALVLMVFATNVLGFMSGAITARKIFPAANPDGMFYGLSTFLIIMGVLQVVSDMSRYGSSLAVIIINAIVIALSIAAVRAVLLKPTGES